MDTLPEMIRILQQETGQNSLEQHVKPAFFVLLEHLLTVLKKDGVVVMNHYMFQLDLDWGYPPILWEDLISILREWLKGCPACKEIFFDGFDPHWWLFLQKRQTIPRSSFFQSVEHDAYQKRCYYPAHGATILNQTGE